MCLIALVSKDGPSGGSVQDFLAPAEILRLTEMIMQRCGVDGSEIGGRATIGEREAFEVAVVDKRWFPRREGLLGVS